MRLFKKDPPRLCPKCGEADGWSILTTEEPQSEMPQPVCRVRDPIGLSVTRRSERSKKILYHCDRCGFEKRY